MRTPSDDDGECMEDNSCLIQQGGLIRVVLLYSVLRGFDLSTVSHDPSVSHTTLFARTMQEAG